MRKLISIIIMLVMSLTSTSVTYAVATQSFTDVPADAWYHDAVCEAATLGYFSGTGNGQFSPDQHLTRAMLVQCLSRAAGVDTSRYSRQRFDDVTNDKWYYLAVNWASETGLVSGMGDGKFCPDVKLNREQLCVIMVHFQELYGARFECLFDYLEFKDDATINSWAHDYVHTLRCCGSVAPRVEDYFVPKAYVTRAELAVVLMSCLGKLDVLPTDPTVYPGEFSISPASLTVEEEQTASISFSVLPANAKTPTVYWSSSNIAVAAVDSNGTVKAISPGNAKILAATADGAFTASCQVKVTKKPEPEPLPAPEPSGRNIDPNKPMIALTFDDGPHKTYSDQILNVLEQYGVVATFFEQGCFVDRYPWVAQRQLALGCEIGSHTYDHANLRNCSTAEIRSQMDRTNRAFIAACGQKPTVMRPPYGARNATVDATVNMPLIMWSVDTLDWKYRDANYVYNYVMNNVSDGDIVLMHSIHQSTAQAVVNIVPALIRRGYQLVTVSELAYYKGKTIQNGKYYYSFK